MSRSAIRKQIPGCVSSAVEKMGFRRSCSIITPVSYTHLQKGDVFRIFKTEMLFARKFDYDKYPDAVNKVLDLLSIRDK